jgi:hypothetical protein
MSSHSCDNRNMDVLDTCVETSKRTVKAMQSATSNCQVWNHCITDGSRPQLQTIHLQCLHSLTNSLLYCVLNNTLMWIFQNMACSLSNWSRKIIYVLLSFFMVCRWMKFQHCNGSLLTSFVSFWESLITFFFLKVLCKFVYCENTYVALLLINSLTDDGVTPLLAHAMWPSNIIITQDNW